MTDTTYEFDENNERIAVRAKTHREVKRELVARLDTLSDATKELFPGGPVGTDAHKTAYDAIGSALGAVKALLVATPAHDEFRRIVFDAVKDAWGITGGTKLHDSAVTQALAIAEEDNRPEKPKTTGKSSSARGKAGRP